MPVGRRLGLRVVDAVNWWTVAPTTGSFAIGLGILVHSVIVWWPGRKHLAGDPWGAVVSALPFVLAYCYGMLLILGVGGLLGWIANAALWGVGWVGDGALVYGVGGERSPLVSGGRVIALTNGGLMMVLVSTFVTVACRKVAGKHAAQQIGRGVLSGILTGTVPAVSAFAAVPLASFMNASGAWMNGVGQ